MGKQFEEKDIVVHEEVLGEEFIGNHGGEKPSDKTTHVAHFAEDPLEHLGEEVSKDEDVVVVIETEHSQNDDRATIEGPVDEDDYVAHEGFEKVDDEEA